MDSDFFSGYGLSYNEEITLNKVSKVTSFYEKKEGSVEDVVLQLYRTDGVGNPIPWEDYNIQDIMDWLVTDDFSPFISEDNLDKVYYFKCKSIKPIFTKSNKNGYLEVTFQPFSQYSYRQFFRKFAVETHKELSFYNYSNVDDNYAPIIEIENVGDEGNVISIRNLTTNKDALVINGLKNGEKIIIDNLIGSVLDLNGNNLISKCNRKWFKMTKNNNLIRFEGKAKISIKAQYPMRG